MLLGQLRSPRLGNIDFTPTAQTPLHTRTPAAQRASALRGRGDITAEVLSSRSPAGMGCLRCSWVSCGPLGNIDFTPNATGGQAAHAMFLEKLDKRLHAAVSAREGEGLEVPETFRH